MEELQFIADLCIKHNVICISDEVYEWLVYNGVQHIRIGESFCDPQEIVGYSFTNKIIPHKARFINLSGRSIARFIAWGSRVDHCRAPDGILS